MAAGTISPQKLFRLRSERYLKHIRGMPCLVCGAPGEAHHLQRAQPRALSRKTGDQYCVPLCHSHHMEMHEFPAGETVWWACQGIKPIVWAENEYARWKNGDDDE